MFPLWGFPRGKKAPDTELPTFTSLKDKTVVPALRLVPRARPKGQYTLSASTGRVHGL